MVLENKVVYVNHIENVIKDNVKLEKFKIQDQSKGSDNGSDLY